jgi:hypothetical protein
MLGAAAATDERSASSNSGPNPSTVHAATPNEAASAAKSGTDQIDAEQLVTRAALVETSFGGAGMSQFWVIIRSRSLPTTSTTSASSHNSPIGLACGGPGTAQGWCGGSRPRAA